MTRDVLALLGVLKQVYGRNDALERALVQAWPSHSHLLVDNIYFEAPKNQVFFEAVQQLHALGFHDDPALFSQLRHDGPGWLEAITAVEVRVRGVGAVDSALVGLLGGAATVNASDSDSLVYGGSLDWSRADTRALHDALGSGWPTLAGAQQLAIAAGLDPTVPSELHDDPWRVLLARASAVGLVEALLTAALADDAPQTAGARGQILPFITQNRPVVAAPQELPPAFIGTPEAQVTPSDNLRPIWFLDVARARSRSVCQVRVQGSAGTLKGTGFVIGPNRILTNHHVLMGAGVPDQVRIWFDFELTAEGQPTPPLVLDGAVDTIKASGQMQGPLEERVDWATIDTVLPIPTASPPLPLTPGSRTGEGRRCYIIHHPAGGEKQITLQGNHVQHAGENILQYLTHTEKGSSGAPVFDEAWRLVAMHFAGGALVDPDSGARVHRNMGLWVDTILADPNFPGVG